MYTILGAGLTGISTSYHLGHNSCIVFEEKNYIGGHINSEYKNGFVWDEGPHVSFTNNLYVKNLFDKSLKGDFLEYPVFPTNYFNGIWIPHPAQSNLYALPAQIRIDCLNDFLKMREENNDDVLPTNYEEWLNIAFGKTFAAKFPAVYTKKYWTTDALNLSIDWVGERVFYPDIETVKKGFEKPLEESTHYIKSVRYPNNNGFIAYSKMISENQKTCLNHKVQQIDLDNRFIFFSNGKVHKFEKLISTLPLPEFIKFCNPPESILIAAEELTCSQLLLINLEINHPSIRTEQWLYVYDEDKYSTRVNFTDLLSLNNAPAGKSGIQVEVYFSKYRPRKEPIENIINKVSKELIEMGLILSESSIENIHTKFVPYANVVFDLSYKKNLNKILNWLSDFGLNREDDDLHPITNWENKFQEKKYFGDIILAGRYAQWKYYWTDDCILRGKYISENLNDNN